MDVRRQIKEFGVMKQTGIIFLIFLVIFFTPVSSVWSAGPSLSMNTFNINFSAPTELSLDDGYIDKDSRVNVHAIKLKINGGDEDQNWKLYVRAANSILSPGAYGKDCGDLKWKFDHENENSYRKIRNYNQLVASGSGVANATKYIDLRMMLDWSDPPASYSLGLTFTLKVE
jgi:hypothetical protein